MGDVLEPVSLLPAHAVVAERLRRTIALGEVLPGERLPAERALAGQLGVSRLTVRGALRLLQEDGAIVTRRGAAGGAFVTARPALLDEERIREVFEYRLAVETAAARLAAGRRTAEDLARLAEHGRSLERSADAGAFRRADSAFHLAVADAGANAMLRRSIEDARAATFDAFDALPFRVLRETSARGHAAVAQAISGGDGDAAAAAMAEHLTQARDEILDVLRRAGRAP
jgi:GntR family transcriptional repressor for pyruvate dehydrogenase complex